MKHAEFVKGDIELERSIGRILPLKGQDRKNGRGDDQPVLERNECQGTADVVLCRCEAELQKHMGP